MTVQGVRMAAALTVAGTDSSGGAGASADLRAFAAFGVWGTVAVTAVTAQTPAEVGAVSVVDPAVVARQMLAAREAHDVRAFKTGMLAGEDTVAVVSAVIEGWPPIPFVLDPVQVASSGGSLLDPAALPLLRSSLLAACTLVTPNLPEASALLGGDVTSKEEMADAAAALADLGPAAVLVKGGHLIDEPSSPDVLWEAGRVTWLEAPRIAGTGAHGSGCALSAAITAGLACGVPLAESCRRAKEYVSDAIGAASVI